MEAPLRPGMRRKSSASNLLSSFQGSRNAAQGAVLPNGAPNKDWDGTVSVPDSNTSAGSSSLGVPTSSTESVRETLSRRLLAIAHVRQSYEGCLFLATSLRLSIDFATFRKQHWLNTVLIDNFDLERTYTNANMRKRYVTML